MKKLLNFQMFESKILNEANDEVEGITTQIISVLFDIYGKLLTVSPGYTNIVKDLSSLVKGDAESKKKSMEDMIYSVSSKVSDAYKNSISDYEEATEEVLKAYDVLLSQSSSDEDKKTISDVVGEKSLAFTTSLKDAKSEIKESISFKNSDLIVEAVNTKERKDLLNTAVVLKGTLDSKIEDKALSNLKSTAESLLDELNKIVMNINDEDYWSSKKRKERKAELEKMAERMSEIPEDLRKKEIEILRKLDADSQIVKALEEARKKITLGDDKINSIQVEEIQEAPEKEEKEEEDSPKEEKKSYSNIDPEDIKNMRKDGPNREIIREFQKKTNEILQDSPGYQKIDEDGLYGKKTKEAISKVQRILNGLGAGLNTEGNLTAETQKIIDNFIGRKEDISQLIKSDNK